MKVWARNSGLGAGEQLPPTTDLKKLEEIRRN